MELESEVHSLDYDLGEAKFNIERNSDELDSLSSAVSDLQSESSGNYQRPSARELYNQLEERERKRREELSRRKRK